MTRSAGAQRVEQAGRGIWGVLAVGIEHDDRCGAAFCECLVAEGQGASVAPTFQADDLRAAPKGHLFGAIVAAVIEHEYRGGG